VLSTELSELSALKRNELKSETDQNTGLMPYSEVLCPMHTVHVKPVQAFAVAPEPYTPITLYGVTAVASDRGHAV
jgi:hypothetical protein